MEKTPHPFDVRAATNRQVNKLANLRVGELPVDATAVEEIVENF
jgi:hypothetical protein